MKKILLTAFEPFGGEETNSSLEVLKNITKNVTKLELPTIYDKAYLKIKEYLSYDYIIMLGQASSRTKISLERFAQNLDDTLAFDNENKQRINKIIIPNSDLIYQTNLDITHLHKKLNEKVISSEISNYAGNFVCNNTYFHVLNEIYTKKLTTKAIFIHFPYLDNLSLNMAIEALNTIIDGLNM